jgi:phage tail sheath gpL-like
MAIVIDGFPDSYKVPGFYGQTKYGQSAGSLGAAALRLLVVGLKTAAGSMVADQDVVQVFSPEDCDTYAGAGSELGRMGQIAMLYKGIKVFLAAPSAAGGAAAATATITIAGAWSAIAGTLKFWIGGVLVEVGVTATMTTATLVADAITATVNANARLPVTAANVAGVVTLTHKNVGIRGNQLLLAQDSTGKPAGMTSTIAGGTALYANLMLPFSGGTGTDSQTALLAVLNPLRFDRIVVAANDSTSAAAWETQIDDKAGPLEGRMEHCALGLCGTLAAATSIAQTTLNDHRFQLVWMRNGETPPGEVAASMAALRVYSENPNPNKGYDGVKLLGVKGHRYAGDRPNASTQQAALDAGVTPITTNDEGDAIIVRAVTTRSLDGALPDYKTLDTAEAIVPDYARDRFRLRYATFVQNNPYVRDDPSPKEKSLPSGVAHPRLWQSELTDEMQKMEAELILTSVADNPPHAEWNAAGKRIMSVADVVPLPIQHQIGVVIRQLNAA